MKKNHSYIWISLIILIFGIIFIPKIVDRVKNRNIVDHDRHKIGQNTQKNEKLLVIGKVPSFEFTDQSGETINNEDYKNKVYVVEFFFTTCPTICPVMNRNMVQLQNEFYKNPDFGIASFTINPEHDTPQVLTAYAEKYGATHKHWHMLTGDREKIYALANSGFNLYVGKNNDAEGGFEHSGMFALIDKNGNIRSRKDKNGNPIVYYDGIEPEGIQMLKEDITKLLDEQ